MNKTHWLSPVKAALGPLHMVALVDVGLFLLLAFRNDGFDGKALFLGISAAVIAYVTSLILIHRKMGDVYICAIVSMLVGIGLVMQYRLSTGTGQKQFLWFLVGSAVFLAVGALYARFSDRKLDVWASYGAMVALFLATLIFGTELKGARNWIVVGGISAQPSELIKILFVFFMSAYIETPQRLRLRFKGRELAPKWTLMLLVFSLLIFFAVQREYGTALLVFGVYVSMLYVFERNIHFTFGNIALAGLGAAAALKKVYHLQVRIDTWLNPWDDISGKGYQITQSLFAIGAGSFFGTGIGLGHPQFIPAVHTDFIFAALCEESGVFGGIAVILLFFMLVYRGVKIALRLKTRYNKAIAFGLTAMLGYQTFIIIGGAIKLIPLTGITLPFLSYGGSSLISSFIVLGLLQALSGPVMRQEVIVNENGLR